MTSLLDSLSRRQFLGNVYFGPGGHRPGPAVGRRELGRQRARPGSPAAARRISLPRRSGVLQIFCPGAASHIDLWEHKPELEKRHGQPLPGEKIVSFQGNNGNLMRSPWPFAPAGSSGKQISSLLPHMAAHVDDIAFIHSMTSKSNTHGPGCVFMNTGNVQEGFPSAGAWISYALGSANDNLPTYVAIPDIRGEPPNGKANWSNGFLPAQHQAIVLAAQQPIRNLETPAGNQPGRGTGHARFSRPAQPAPRRSASGRERVAGPHRGLRVGGADATFGPRGFAPGRRIGHGPQALRHRRSQSAQGGLCPQLPAWPGDCWSGAFATSTCIVPRGPRASMGC